MVGYNDQKQDEKFDRKVSTQKKIRQPTDKRCSDVEFNHAKYRRLRIRGAPVFITLVTYQRVPFLIQPDAIKILRNVWKYVSTKHPFTTDAVCLLPDHIHMLITLPDNDTDYSLRIREIKRNFTKRYLLTHGEPFRRYESHEKKNETTLWQRRFWEHIIRDESDYRNHFNYIHYNPVKHGLVKAPSSWKWSSFHRCVRAGVYDEDWGMQSEVADFRGDFGE